MQQKVDDISPSDTGKEFGLTDIAVVIDRRRKTVISVTVAFGILAIVAAMLAPRMYQASVLLAPVSSPGGGGLGALGSMAGQLGGLSSLVGLSLSPGADGKTEAIASLQSAALTRRYIEENDLLPVLYSGRWDSSKRRWSTSDVPTLWQANEMFAKRIRKVSEDTRTGLVTLTITWEDPVVAATWANALVDLANNDLRSKAIEEYQRAIAYLRDQAEAASILELRSAIYSLMKSEIEKEMLARGREEYALKVVDPAIAPEKHSSPAIALWVLAGVFGGFVISIMIALAQEYRSSAGGVRS